MFAINHAATSLIIKRIFPDVPMVVILMSVQLIEGFWVILNFLGIEKTTTENKVDSVSDVHLEFMPFSQQMFHKLLRFKNIVFFNPFFIPTPFYNYIWSED